MYVRKCVVCGKRFATSSRNKIICSEKCREQRKKEREEFAAEKNKKKNVTEKKAKIKICKQCGKEFAMVHNTQKYCSKECQQKSRKYISLGRRTFTCEFCGNSFEANAKRKFCCIECRQGAERAARLRKKPKKPKLSLNQVAKLSREAGKSYGKYVADEGL